MHDFVSALSDEIEQINPGNVMNVKRTLVLAGAAILLCWGTHSAMAQAGGGGGDNGGFGGRRGGFGGPPSPELESLQNAIESNAPTEQIKAAMEKFRVARKAREEALQKAQDDLKAVLTVKQEAVALSNGLLN
jgi:hypothetical protein